MPSVSFPSDQLISLFCSLFCLSQVHSGSNVFSLQCYSVTLYWVTIFLLSNVLWIPVRHQYFVLIMLSHCKGYIYNTEKYNMKNTTQKITPTTTLTIFFKITFTSLPPWKLQHEKYNTHNTRVYNTLIQHTRCSHQARPVYLQF